VGLRFDICACGNTRVVVCIKVTECDSSYVFQGWSCCQVVRERLLSGSGHQRFPHTNLGDFEQQFRLHFFLVNAEVDVINTLEGTSYHQGGWMVDDYLDNFRTLVSDAGYTDPRTLVVKF